MIKIVEDFSLKFFLSLYFVMANYNIPNGENKESRRIEVIKTTPFLIGITIATLVIIAGATALGVVYGKNSFKIGNSVNVENNINVQVVKESKNSKGLKLNKFVKIVF